MSQIAKLWRIPLAVGIVWCSIGDMQAQTVVYGRKQCCPPPCYMPCPTPCPQVVEPPKPPDKPVTPMPEQPDQPIQEPTFAPEQFAATGAGENYAAAAPQVIGDSSPGTGAAAIRAGALKVSENMTVRPQTRAYFGYNYFNNVGGVANVHRQMPGFEYAFLDGNASFGMTLPIFETEQVGNPLNINGFGNLNMFGKYALYNNLETGDIITGGMQLTAPTGRGLLLPNGSKLYSVIFQPFAGYFFNVTDNLFVQGFSSIAVPTDADDFTVLFNDLAVGYWAYRNGNNGIVPTLEGHVTTPLTNRGLNNSVIGLQDIFVLTGGVHVVLDRIIVTFGAATPLTGPQPWDVEAIGQVNWRFGYQSTPLGYDPAFIN